MFTRSNSYVGYIIVLIDVTKDVEMDQLRSHFISNVSHELRTPVTVLRSYIDTLYNFGNDFDCVFICVFLHFVYKTHTCIRKFRMTKFAILGKTDDENSPFFWLQSVQNSNLAFVIMNPRDLVPDYEVEIDMFTANLLQIKDENDALIYSIVTVPEDISKISKRCVSVL